MRTLPLAPLLLAVALVHAETPAPEPAMTAGDLQQLCTGTDHVSRNSCRIYILGVTQGIAVGMQMAKVKGGTRSCVAARLSAEELEQTVRSRLEADLAAKPQDAGRPAAKFIGRVVARAYICPQGGAPGAENGR